MAKDGGDQRNAVKPIKTRADQMADFLPDHLRNPVGVYSGSARRNALEDGAFFPEAETTPAKRRVRRPD